MSLGRVRVETYPHSDVVRMHLLIGREFDGVGRARIKPVVNGGVFQDRDARDVMTVQLFALLAKQFRKRLKGVRRLLHRRPLEPVTALLGMGRSLIARDRFVDALEYHRRAAAEQPRNAVAQARLGLNYFKLGDLESAERCLLAAERIDPANYTRPQLLLAEIYFREGEEQAASGQLTDYTKRFPGEEDAATAVRTRAKGNEQAEPVRPTLTAGR